MGTIYKLQVSGRVSESSYKLVEKGFKRKFDKDLIVDFFCAYSEYEIPLGVKFNYLKNILSQAVIEIDAMLTDVTQQWGIPFDTIPMGYKTISRLKFSKKDLPVIEREIPVIDSWFESKFKFELLQEL